MVVCRESSLPSMTFNFNGELSSNISKTKIMVNLKRKKRFCRTTKTNNILTFCSCCSFLRGFKSFIFCFSCRRRFGHWGRALSSPTSNKNYVQISVYQKNINCFCVWKCFIYTKINCIQFFFWWAVNCIIQRTNMTWHCSMRSNHL